MAVEGTALDQGKQETEWCKVGFWLDSGPIKTVKDNFCGKTRKIKVATGYWKRIDIISVNFVKCDDNIVVIQDNECLYFWICVITCLGYAITFITYLKMV